MDAPHGAETCRALRLAAGKTRVDGAPSNAAALIVK